MCLKEDVDYLSKTIPLRRVPPHEAYLADRLAAAEQDAWRRANRLPPYDIPPPAPPQVVLIPKIYNDPPKKVEQGSNTGEDQRVIELSK